MRQFILLIHIVLILSCEQDINNNENLIEKFSCINNSCIVSEDGLYTSLNECINNCNVNNIYTGNWNFRGNGISYSGYYVYDSLLNSEWVSNVTYTTNYNDSLGTIQIGENIDELVFKYCETCDPIIYNLNDSGFVYSESLGGNIGWVLTDTTFFNIVTPQPPGYSSSYSTYNIEGWKLE